MSLDHRLIDLLVCPSCKGPLQMLRDEQSRPTALSCPADRLAFPIRDGIAVMLESEARPLDAADGADSGHGAAGTDSPNSPDSAGGRSSTT